MGGGVRRRQETFGHLEGEGALVCPDLDRLHVRDIQLRPHQEKQIQHQDMLWPHLEDPPRVPQITLPLDEESRGSLLFS